MEFIEITAQYSNIVLLAILPHVTEFAAKLELPVPNPITTNHVRTFVCYPRRSDVGGWLTLTNGYEFWFRHGIVGSFLSPKSYFSLQDTHRIPEFYGTRRLSKKQAIQFARDSVIKMGYTLKELTADLEPEVTVGGKYGTNVIPYYDIEWKDPQYPKQQYMFNLEIEVNADRKRIEALYLGTTNIWRGSLKIDFPIESLKTIAPADEFPAHLLK